MNDSAPSSSTTNSTPSNDDYINGFNSHLRNTGIHLILGLILTVIMGCFYWRIKT